MRPNTTSQFILKPSFARILMFDVGFLVGVYLLGTLARAIFDRASAHSLISRIDFIGLGVLVIWGLITGVYKLKHLVIRVENGSIEGPVRHSLNPDGFPLDRLDRQRTIENLEGNHWPWLKGRRIWSMDGDAIDFSKMYYNPEDVEELMRLLGQL